MDNNALTIATINDYPADKFNRLFPATVMQLSPLYRVMVNTVWIDTDLSAKEVYKQKNGEYSLTKIGCLKLMAAANVTVKSSKSVLPKNCKRCVEIAKATRLAPPCAGCPTRDDVAYEVSILVPEPSGGYREFPETKEVTKQNTLADKNPVKHMAANCETKALLRAGRAGLGLKGSYTLPELAKPFAVAVVTLNTQDPELKAALIARLARSQDALFGGSPESLSSGDYLQLPEGAINGEVVVAGDDPEDDNDIQVPQCEGCHKVIEPYEMWTAEMIAENLKAKYGKVICSACRDAVGGAQR